MSGKLTVYSPKSKCPKCGNATVNTRYEGPIDSDPRWYHRKYEPPNKWPEHEYMHRTCGRCHYEWPEKVLPRAALSPAPEDGKT